MVMGGGAMDDDSNRDIGRNIDGGGGKKKRRFNIPPNRNPILFVRKVLIGMGAFRKLFAARFAALSKKGKAMVSAQLFIDLFILALIFGSITRKTVLNYSNGGTAVKIPAPIEIPYSTFMDLAEANKKKVAGTKQQDGTTKPIQMENVVIGRDRISFRIVTTPESTDLTTTTTTPTHSRLVYTMKPAAMSPDLLDLLRSNDINFRAASNKKTNAIANTSRAAIFFVYLLFMVRMYRSMSGTGGGTPGKLANKRAGATPNVKFEDIEGIDKAKYEVMELVDTLRNPSKYQILGARAPKGLLLVGPPGTGKTMLARATAATAGVPLLYCSGSDFVEMFVGRGAARVRKTFARAGKMSPCIIFIDELDALGKSRDKTGFKMQSNDEAEQTLNQLLACMDGLDSTTGVCVLAATNRKEVLDNALTRPGRFDRIVRVELPDAGGRERILRVHANKLPGFTEGRGVDPSRLGSLGKGNVVDLSAVALVTNGLSGAELDVLVNEAAIRAVRRVSNALREKPDQPLGDVVVPNVCARDFEESVTNFYETRKGSGNNSGVGDLMSSVFGK